MKCDKIQKLINSLDAKSNWNNRELVDFVRELDIKEQDIVQYQTYQHSPQFSYGRNRIFQNNRFKVYLMSWNYGDVTAIHNHGSIDWGFVQFFGQAIHCTYSETDKLLKLIKKEIISQGALVAIKGELTHLMGNMNEKSICTLHVYGMNEFDIEEDKALVYQPEYDRIVITKGSAYINMNESEVLSIIKGLNMSLSDYQNYLEIIKPFYKRINKSIVK